MGNRMEGEWEMQKCRNAQNAKMENDGNIYYLVCAREGVKQRANGGIDHRTIARAWGNQYLVYSYRGTW
jgi:hypothetical protein